MWKGTVLEDRTVPLLGMLLTENGALAEHVRGDHGYAIGLEQHHICRRPFPDKNGKQYCGAGAEARLAKDLPGTRYAGWLTDWRVQFKHYTDTVEGMTKEGHSVDSIIKSWNSKEIGRRDKVRRNEKIVEAALR